MKTNSTTIRTGFFMLAFAGCLVLGMTNSLAQLDFGDAPDSPYPTLLINDGARHAIGGPVLGTVIDAEANGQPTIPADGDDIAGAMDDEDGVTFKSVLVPGTMATVDVETSGTGPYILNAWVDFNNDGDWLDAGEQIFTDTVLIFGLNAGLTFPVPAGARLGKRTYSRWRIDDGVTLPRPLKPTGGINNGEVEDYCLGSIHGQKWYDQNQDAIKGPDEPGLNGWDIQLYDPADPLNPADDVLITTVTTQDKEVDGKKGINRYTERGLYWIGGVPEGFFIIREVLQANAVQSYPLNCGTDHFFVKVNECQVLGRVPPDNPPVCGGVPNWVFDCPDGIDEMFSVAQIEIEPPGGPPNILAFASGDTIIERREDPNPGPTPSFETEMLSMDLTGLSPDLGPFHVRAGADFDVTLTSTGKVVERPTGEIEADSFFDVFFEIEVQGQIFRPLTNFVQVDAVPGITEIPPINSQYIELPPTPIPLLTHPGGMPSGFSLVQLAHKPKYGLDFGNHNITVRPDCCIGKKAAIGTHKFNNVYLPNRQRLRCKGKVQRPVKWFVTIENDGDVPDVICGKSSRFNRAFKARCIELGGGNVTAALLKGRYFRTLAPGEVKTIKCIAKAADRRSPRRLTLRNSIKATSKTDPTKIDKVDLLAKLKGAG